ncbi:hypothetical protein [Paraburkholderia bryophila]|uniref:Uncharacterized protein n=1 Tax=Paraburkholderia bryophila TaxID=420952 RepID=A0A329CVX1_9BURK|nr:hypothetical protein [Paraburkholderia bryophila]RAS35874.1 hypothetical protein BX591_104204 [Paraburkholderia bryophila]
MNQSAFAELHGVSRKTVTKWKERGWLVFAGDDIDVDASNANLKKYRRDGTPTVTQPVTQPVTQGTKGNKLKTVTLVASDVTPGAGAEATANSC